MWGEDKCEDKKMCGEKKMCGVKKMCEEKKMCGEKKMCEEKCEYGLTSGSIRHAQRTSLDRADTLTVPSTAGALYWRLNGPGSDSGPQSTERPKAPMSGVKAFIRGRNDLSAFSCFSRFGLFNECEGCEGCEDLENT